MEVAVWETKKRKWRKRKLCPSIAPLDIWTDAAVKLPCLSQRWIRNITKTIRSPPQLERVWVRCCQLIWQAFWLRHPEALQLQNNLQSTEQNKRLAVTVWACALKEESSYITEYVVDWVWHHHFRLVCGKAQSEPSEATSVPAEACSDRDYNKWSSWTKTSVSAEDIFKLHYSLNYIKQGKPTQAWPITSVL